MRKFTILSILSVVTLASCSLSGISEEEKLATAIVLAQTAMAETSAAIPTDTPLPTATATPTKTPTLTPTATEIYTATPTDVPTVDIENSLAYFLIAIDEEDGSGCTYTARAIYIGANRSNNPISDITNALNALFSLSTTSVYGLSNPLGQSTLQVGSVTSTSADSVNVNITGNLVRPPKGCSWSQMLSQIQTTARFAAKEYTVTFQYKNGPLKDYLSPGA